MMFCSQIELVTNQGSRPQCFQRLKYRQISSPTLQVRIKRSIALMKSRSRCTYHLEFFDRFLKIKSSLANESFLSLNKANYLQSS